MNFIEALQNAGCQVDVVGYEREDRSAPVPLPAGFSSPRRLVIESAQSPTRSALWMARAIVNARPFSVQKYVTKEMADLVRRKLRSNRWDLVIIDHVQAAWMVAAIPDDLPVAYVAHNIEHRLYGDYDKRVAKGLRGRAKSLAYRREARLLRHLERRTAERARAVWTLTDDDAAALRSLGGGTPVWSFSVPGQCFAHVDRFPPPSTDIGLLGSWTWDINRVGLDWFLAEVVPKLPADLTVVVGGKSRYAPGTQIGRVHFTGFVPDAGAFLRKCRVAVIPTTIGSGVQIKTIETLSLGVATVATPVAMRGLHDVPSSVRIESDAAGMSAAIQDLLQAPRGDGAEGRRWWEDRQARFQAQVKDALDDLLSAARQPPHRNR
ncbi:hypothetical protein W911_04475 [Hyphomicrobium nitrativorans NL23]|uniref:Glycosyltransferase subfamily 4-like N-terminal domain-containing protein n=2 Tax=Hyphomicrobium TaxID=81 RepID=V5SGF1_9HYPH|nr:hypothetical protein W911_04475 [Hyphomicrobium nitrativorans NL23]